MKRGLGLDLHVEWHHGGNGGLGISTGHKNGQRDQAVNDFKGQRR